MSYSVRLHATKKNAKPEYSPQRSLQRPSVMKTERQAKEIESIRKREERERERERERDN